MTQGFPDLRRTLHMPESDSASSHSSAPIKGESFVDSQADLTLSGLAVELARSRRSLLRSAVTGPPTQCEQTDQAVKRRLVRYFAHLLSEVCEALLRADRSDLSTDEERVSLTGGLCPREWRVTDLYLTRRRRSFAGSRDANRRCAVSDSLTTPCEQRAKHDETLECVSGVASVRQEFFKAEVACSVDTLRQKDRLEEAVEIARRILKGGAYADDSSLHTARTP